jgi:hypothetical protein
MRNEQRGHWPEFQIGHRLRLYSMGRARAVRGDKRLNQGAKGLESIEIASRVHGI